MVLHVWCVGAWGVCADSALKGLSQTETLNLCSPDSMALQKWPLGWRVPLHVLGFPRGGVSWWPNQPGSNVSGRVDESSRRS